MFGMLPIQLLKQKPNKKQTQTDRNNIYIYILGYKKPETKQNVSVDETNVGLLTFVLNINSESHEYFEHFQIQIKYKTKLNHVKQKHASIHLQDRVWHILRKSAFPVVTSSRCVTLSMIIPRRL